MTSKHVNKDLACLITLCAEKQVGLAGPAVTSEWPLLR
jgi:hypothetical protein